MKKCKIKFQEVMEFERINLFDKIFSEKFLISHASNFHSRFRTDGMTQVISVNYKSESIDMFPGEMHCVL